MVTRKQIDAYDQRVLATVAEYGWALQGVFPTRDNQGPPFTYTVGLTAFHHPELILFGLPSEIAGPILNDMGGQIRTGRVFIAGETVHDVIAGYEARIVAVRDSTEHLTVANRLFGDQQPLQALQVVWPDNEGRFPWQDEYTIAAATQPVLGAP